MSDPDFQNSDDIVSRADAFMKRQRPAAARPEELDDLPLLTDVVSPAPASALPPSPAPDLEALGQALAEAIGRQLAAAIPALVEASMQAAAASIAWDIRQGLEEISRKAIADFLAAPRNQGAEGRIRQRAEPGTAQPV